ncbi:PREDICTED: OX-2 membrane glycoprotein-like [Elephantulus edwardii]|uniref:OX-2 membrane glycoprotein-like n=1 Tax=Elephantulus edwardii TaxID=28737 RepID=UPI0003F0E15D|nr:PREDICTED: OX-2 membrane glycoprotein-like [Elephantulus edwardii]
MTEPLLRDLEKNITDSFYRIWCKKSETAALGENVTMFCNLTTLKDVLQITWQKIGPSSPQNIGTYSSKYGMNILPPYLNRLQCETIEPNSSFITIREVKFEDEACYKCLFNIFPHGSHGGQTCLNILSVSELRTELQSNPNSEGFLSIINSAVGKPPPQISLSPSQILSNPPEEHHAQNPNGTVTVTKMDNISLETVWSLDLQHVTVRMDHPLRSEEKNVSLPPKPGEIMFLLNNSLEKLNMSRETRPDSDCGQTTIYLCGSSS